MNYVKINIWIIIPIFKVQFLHWLNCILNQNLLFLLYFIFSYTILILDWVSVSHNQCLIYFIHRFCMDDIQKFVNYLSFLCFLDILCFWAPLIIFIRYCWVSVSHIDAVPLKFLLSGSYRSHEACSLPSFIKYMLRSVNLYFSPKYSHLKRKVCPSKRTRAPPT